MRILGYILVFAGALVFISSNIVYRKTNKMMNDYKTDDNNDNDFLSLLNSVMLIIKITGSMLVIVGAIFILVL